MKGWIGGVLLAASGAGGASAQEMLPPPAPVLGIAEAIAVDAVDYAARHGVSVDDATARLRAQEWSVTATERLRLAFADRLAGIAIEHRPAFRIVVLLTGDAPVADETLSIDGLGVPVTFRTGAAATHAALVAALGTHQAAIRAMARRPPGMGIDPRTGELVVLASGEDATARDDLRARIALLTGVPVRVETYDAAGANASGASDIRGGSRVVGTVEGRRYVCTAGFVVTDGAATGVVTAAHCPDEVSHVGPARAEVALPFAGQWGWGHQDVQLNLSAEPLAPLFYSDTARATLRPVTARRTRAATRAGDTVCHRGERTGYSCAEVVLTDFAPAGDLCGGACLPTWVAVAGPTCRGGDSGGPVFLGTTAFGIVKGGSYRADGRCTL